MTSSRRPGEGNARAARADDRLELTYARKRQFDQFLASPDRTGPSSATYVYRTAADPLPAAEATPEPGDEDHAAGWIVLAGVLAAALPAAAVLWASLLALSSGFFGRSRGELEIRGDLVEVPEHLLGHRALEHRDERGERVDRERPARGRGRPGRASRSRAGRPWRASREAGRTPSSAGCARAAPRASAPRRASPPQPLTGSIE